MGTPLNEAVIGNDVSACRAAIDQGVDVDDPNHLPGRSMTLFCIAVQHENFDIADLLLEAGANVNTTSVGYTCLHHSIMDHEFAISSYLIERGADLEATDSRGRTPLYCAVAYKNFEALQMLVDHGADLNAKCEKDEHTALHWATSVANADGVQFLLSLGANANAVDGAGKKPSQVAIEKFFPPETRHAKRLSYISDTLTTAERREELQQIAAVSRPAEAEIAAPRRSPGFMM